MNEYLKVIDLECGYKDGFKLKNITFSVDRKTICGIVGPNGSGKTTLIRVLTGILKIHSGQIYIGEKNINKITRKEKALLMAVVSQYMTPVSMTVEEYVMMGRIPHRKFFQFYESSKDITIVNKYLKTTGIYNLKDKFLTELSGGELQLAAIAKALVQEPQLLILDEPTAHLDISHQVKILNLLQSLAEELELTILISLHDLNLASEYCNKLILMNNGTIYASGKPEEVLTYENIEKVYNTVVITLINPLSNKPFVSIVPEKILEKYRK